MKKISDTFCILPWVHVASRPDGTPRLCCYTRSNTIRKDNNISYKLGDDSIEEIWNSNYMKDVRLKMINGEKVHDCAKCYKMEELGGSSNRLLCNKFEMIDDIDNIIEYTKKHNGETTTKPTFFDLRLGNLCNLKCRMCSPINSSQIQKEFSNINDFDHIFNPPVDSNTNTWFLDEKFWNDLEKYIPYIHHLYFTGGEPTIIEQHYVFLEGMIERGFTDILLRYNTNLTNVQPRFLNILKNFKNVRLSCSLDGYGKINDYIRSPSKWEIVSQNFETYINEVPHVSVSIASTVQAMNVLYLDDLYNWLYDINTKYNESLHVNMSLMSNPRRLTVDVLTPKLKQMALDRLNKMDTTFVYKPDRLEAVKKKLKEPEPDDIIELRNQFKYYTKTLDKVRNENLLEVAPELSDIYKD